MPSNHKATKSNARFVWRSRDTVYVCFGTVARAFEAIDRLREQGRQAEYFGGRGGHYRVVFSGGASKKQTLSTPIYDGNRFI